VSIEHKQPTSEQMRDAIMEKGARGERLGAFHNPVWADAKGEWSDDHPVTDEEKHAFCIWRTGFCATFISPSLYKQAEREGLDMRRFVKNRPMPTLKVGGKVIGHITKINIGRYRMKRRCRGCSGFCLLGLNGKCVACSEDDWT
jgi:hypothetical protein